MAGWHHWLNEHEFEQTLGDSEGRGSLVCCGPCGHRVIRDLATEQQGKIEGTRKRGRNIHEFSENRDVAWPWTDATLLFSLI